MNWKNQENRRLIQAIMAIKTPTEARSFLRDLMTEKEIEEFSKRLQAAEMLMINSSYSEIENETGLSSATIARVSKWLNNGMNGYKTIINKLHHHNSIRIGRGLS